MELRAIFCSLVLWLVLHTTYSKNTPPEITTPNKRTTRDIMEDQAVTLNCQANSEPKSSYIWKFEGTEVTANDVKVNKETGDLIITKFAASHQGDYQCFAENEIRPGLKAVAMSAVVTLREVELGQDWPKSNDSVIEVNEGDYAGLACDNAPKSVPDGKFYWYLSTPLSLSTTATGKGEVKSGDRIYIDAEGTLHFLYVKKDDESGSLTYQCGIFNNILSLIKLGSEKELKVKEVPGFSIPETGPVKRFSTQHAKFFKTKEAQLQCVFSGNPLPTVTWTNHKGVEIKSGDKYQIEDNGYKLIIKDLEYSDQGTYKCQGVSTMNLQGPEDGTIWLEVIAGPIWVSSLTSKTVPEDKEAVFTCKAEAIDGGDLDPPLWFKNGARFATSLDDPKYEFSDMGRVLTVKKLNKETDVMCFQCNVSNNIGYEFGDGCLTVIKPINITTQPELEQHISRGDRVNLTIIGTTDPDYTLQYRWYFKNITYEGTASPPFVTYNETTKQAYINTSGLSDEDYWNINGTYIRELYHQHDEKNVSIHVILKELPPPIAVVAAGADLWWIALIVALVVLIIVIILIVIICNRMRQEGTYPLDKKERSNDIDPEKDLADSGFQDLSRAPGDDDYPTKKSSSINPNFDYGDDLDIDDDESLMEYGGADFDTTKFNEDGSFIGQYTSKNQTPQVKQSPAPLNHHATESQI